jgi:hypothetical protein
MKKVLILFSFFLLANIGCTVSDPEMMELLQEIKAQNDKLLQEVEAMKGTLALLDGKYQVILASLADNKKELEALKSQIDALKAQIAQQLIKIDQLSAQLTQQGADIIKLSQEIKELKASVEELKGLIEELLSCKSPVPTNGLVGWWPFSGNANDESGNENNGTVNGAALTNDRFGNANKAYSFNGQNYIRVQGSSSIDNIETADEFSFVIAFFNSNPSEGAVFSLFNKYNANTDRGWEVFVAKNFVEFFLIDTATIGYLPTNTCIPNLPTGKWVHLAFTYSKQNQMAKLYLDGVLACSLNINVDIPLTQNGPLFFGYSPSGPDEYITGSLDDIALYNRVLSADEISKIYKGEKF